MVVIPEICQPPNTCRFTPLFQPSKRCPGPTGKSITYVNTAWWRTSKDEGPRSARMLLASSSPAGSPLDPKNAEPLSIDFPNVYDPSKYTPCRPWYVAVTTMPL